MTLDIRVEGEHFAVSDGCDISTTDSNVVKSDFSDLDELREFDEACRYTSSRGADRYLFFRNISLVKLLWDANESIVLKCPACGNEYTLVKDDFKIAVEAYEELTKGKDA